MMNSTLISWTDLLSQHFRDVSDEYGPNSQAVASALVILSKTPWLERSGEPLDDNKVTVVQSWDDALVIFKEDPQYNLVGLLEAPCKRVDDVLTRFPERDAWWRKAREDAKEYTILRGIPKSRPRKERDLVFEHLYEFVLVLPRTTRMVSRWAFSVWVGW